MAFFELGADSTGCIGMAVTLSPNDISVDVSNQQLLRIHLKLSNTLVIINYISYNTACT